MRRILTQMVPAVALALSAGALRAQQTTPTPPAAPDARHPVPQRMDAIVRGGDMRGPGMRMGGGAADRLLGLRSQLGLTSDQVSRLEALQKTQAAAPRPRESDALRARADLMDAEQKGDLNAARAVIDRMAKTRADQDFARFAARKSAADVLTADQKAKLEQFGAGRGMRGGRGMRAGRGMRGRPGMRGRGGMPGGGEMGRGPGGFGAGFRARGGGPGGFGGRGMMPREGGPGFRGNGSMNAAPGGRGMPPVRPDSGQ